MNVNGYDIKPYANLQHTDLSGANLSGANLYGANLSGANLQHTDLQYANLLGANLQHTDLQYANLYGANLSGANLRGADLPHFQLVPETGSFTAYKKLQDEVIAKLQILAKARRTSSLVGRKCRAEYVKVLSLTPTVEEGFSTHDNTPYRVGEIITADSYDDDIRVECTHGIHFFITLKEAQEY